MSPKLAAAAMLPVLAGGLGGFWDTYGSDLERLGLIAGGILVYGLIVNFFYQIISRRVMFGVKDSTGNVHVGGPGRGFLYLIFFPLISLAFFLLLSASLLFLQGEGGARTPNDIFVLAMGIVLAVRVAAYFSEPTSHDVAKMLPLGLLGVFLVTEDDFSGLVASIKTIQGIFDNLDVIAIYFAIVVFAEYILRLIYIMVRAMQSPKKPKSAKPTTAQPGRPATGYQPPRSGYNQPPKFQR